jgi:tetratricopeptide (TPR) repeat protein
MAKRTLQDLVEGRQRPTVLDWRVHVRTFRENLNLPVNNPRRRFLFNVHGPSGVGKTFLLQEYVRVASESGTFHAFASQQQTNVLSVMKCIADRIKEQGGSLEEFDERYDQYTTFRQQLEDDPNAPPDLHSALEEAALGSARIEGGESQARPSHRSVVESENSAIDQPASRRFITERAVDSEIAQLLLAPIDALTPLFAQGLYTLDNPSGVAIFFDQFECTADWLESWLIALLEGSYGDLPAEMLITVAGQRPLDRGRWARYLGFFEDVQLGAFTDPEAREYLRKHGIVHERLVQTVLRLSERLPWLVTKLAGDQSSDVEAGDDLVPAIERFLELESRHGKVLIGNAAIPRRLNRDVLPVIVDSSDIAKALTILTGLPFFSEVGSNVWEYDPTVRTAILQQRLRRTPNDWYRLHFRLADAYERRANVRGANEEQRWQDANWQGCTLEATYHRLCEDPRYLAPAMSLMLGALSSAQMTVLKWAEMIQQAGRDAQASEILSWGNRLVECAQGKGDKDLLDVLLDFQGMEVKWRVYGLRERGIVQAGLGHFEAALEDFGTALQLDRYNVTTTGLRGQVYSLLGRYENALADFKSILEVKGTIPLVIASRGETYFRMGRYDEGRSDFKSFLELDSKDPLSVTDDGGSYVLIERYKEALSEVLSSRLPEVVPDYAMAMTSLGKAYRLMRWYHRAFEQFNLVLELDPDNPAAIVGVGETHFLQAQYNDALAAFGRVVELDSDNIQAILDRAYTHFLLKEYPQALEDFNRVIQSDPDNRSALVGRGRTFMSMGSRNEALADFNRGTQLSPTSGLSAWTTSMPWRSPEATKGMQGWAMREVRPFSEGVPKA